MPSLSPCPHAQVEAVRPGGPEAGAKHKEHKDHVRQISRIVLKYHATTCEFVRGTQSKTCNNSYRTRSFGHVEHRKTVHPCNSLPTGSQNKIQGLAFTMSRSARYSRTIDSTLQYSCVCTMVCTVVSGL